MSTLAVLTTSPIPDGKMSSKSSSTLLTNKLQIDRCDGLRTTLALEPRTVADFYSEFMSTLRSLELMSKSTPNLF